jgi:hypothetical protein
MKIFTTILFFLLFFAVVAKSFEPSLAALCSSSSPAPALPNALGSHYLVFCSSLLPGGITPGFKFKLPAPKDINGVEVGGFPAGLSCPCHNDPSGYTAVEGVTRCMLSCPPGWSKVTKDVHFDVIAEVSGVNVVVAKYTPGALHDCK